MTTVTPDNKCPHCNAAIPLATGLQDDTVPKENDITICLSCQEIAIFNADLSVRKPSEDDIKFLKSDTSQWNKIQRIRYYIKEYMF